MYVFMSVAQCYMTIFLGYYIEQQQGKNTRKLMKNINHVTARGKKKRAQKENKVLYLSNYVQNKSN